MRGASPRAVAPFLLLAVGLAAVAIGASAILLDARESASYKTVASTLSPLADVDEATDGSWDGLGKVNDDVVAWLRVDGTSIDLPVTQSSRDDPDWYLEHDLWGDYSVTGNPYLDVRCGPDDAALTIYGHHTSYESYMFHDLSECFRQDVFDGLGELTWAERGGPARTYRPLCATRVRASDATWQRFGGMTTDELRSWLHHGCGQSSSRSASWSEGCETATRAIVLVTCTGRARYGSASRTVVVFASGD